MARTSNKKNNQAEAPENNPNIEEDLLGTGTAGTGTNGDDDLLGNSETGTNGDEDLLGSGNESNSEEDLNGPEDNQQKEETNMEQAKPKFEVKPTEAHLYHVKLKKALYDTKTGKDLSSYTTQKLSIAEYRMLEKNGAGLGFEIEVLHNPEA